MWVSIRVRWHKMLSGSDTEIDRVPFLSKVWPGVMEARKWLWSDILVNELKTIITEVPFLYYVKTPASCELKYYKKSLYSSQKKLKF